MSDRTYSYVRCRPSDAHHFENLGYELQTGGGGVVELFNADANYGNSTELDAVARTGVVFYAWHGAGGNYGPCVQASDGQQFADVEGDGDLHPVVRVLRNGRIERQRLMEAREYWRVHERARKALGEVVEK